MGVEGACGRPSINAVLRVSALAMLFLLLAVQACDRRLEPWVEASQEPPPPERPVRVPGLQVPIPQSAPGMAAGPAPAARAPAAGPGIRGTLRLAEGERVSGGVLFLIARSNPQGPPLAVQRLPAGPFPLEFEIGPGDVMIPGMPFAGAIRLSARIDSDGDPLTRSAADVGAVLDAALQPGATGVELVLRRGGS